METRLKYAIDMVMDAFDDAVLNVPGESKDERIVALVDELLPRLIERSSKAGALDANHDLDPVQKAAFMQLMQKTMAETKGCRAAALVRITQEGAVMVAGATIDLNPDFMTELSKRLKMAVFAMANEQEQADTCGCPRCVARRASNIPGASARMPFTGPKAEA